MKANIHEALPLEVAKDPVIAGLRLMWGSDIKMITGVILVGIYTRESVQKLGITLGSAF